MAQLELLAGARRRVDARRALGDMQALWSVAVAAVGGKSDGVKALERALREQSES